MERMLCEQCAAVTYSAAARTIVERGERCPRCGGMLAVDERAASLSAELAAVDQRLGQPRE